MWLLKTLLLASAVALPITATHVVMSDITVDAAGTKKKAKKATKTAAAKSCGTFMYRKDGKCVDARLKK